jgi:hypothetical protein
MRALEIAVLANCILHLAACSAELVERPPAQDPTHAGSAETPMRATPSYQPDPLNSGARQAEPGKSKPPTSLYACPMHAEIEQPAPGECPKCGMTLVPKGGAR